jgi:hypothetical protein
MEIEIDKNNLALWEQLCLTTKCKMCKKKFPDGIIKKLSRDTTTPLIERFTDEFLEHMKSTHGLFPVMLNEVLLSRFKITRR